MCEYCKSFLFLCNTVPSKEIYFCSVRIVHPDINIMIHMKTKLITLITVIYLFYLPVESFGRIYDVANSSAVSGITTPVMMPPMGLTTNYALYSTNGSVSNSGITYITGDLGTNVGQTTGFDALKVKGMIHPIPDGATNMCSGDLLTLYNTLNLMTPNVELLNSAQFGHKMILTPQVYHLNAATMLTDTLYLNAAGDQNAVFVIQINGALTTTANSRVILMNGATSKNIYWKIEGAITLNDNSTFRGMVVVNNGAIVMKPGCLLDGAAFTTGGAISIASSTVVTPYNGITTAIDNINTQNTVIELTVAPNPFGSFTTINLKTDSKYLNCDFKIYDTKGVEVLNSTVSRQVITLDTSRLKAGIYFYKLTDKNNVIQSGKLISQQ